MNGDFKTKIEPVKCISASEFNNFEEIFKNELCEKRVPLLIKSLNIGDCREKWTWKYLKEKCGSRIVKLHVSSDEKLNFIEKNFTYQSMAFDEFIKNIEAEEHPDRYYLRSLGNYPRKEVCDINKHFPELSADLKFPNLFDEANVYSSVFRIASKGVQLWTHYDIMDNILVEVKGRKRVTLFSPDDVECLYLNGDKSEVIDIDNPDLTKYPQFANVTHHRCYMDDGDVLFIPALWFHNVTNETPTISVNIFWRHLASESYDPSDVYGNKDLVAASSAENILDRVISKINCLPPVYKEFYARRFIAKIRQKCL